MANESQESAEEAKAESPVVELNPVPAIPRKSNNKLWIIAGSLAIICLFSTLCLALVGLGMGKVMVETPPVTSVLDTFMKYMEMKDVKSAYDLFSPRSQRQFSMVEFKKLTKGNNYELFEGYESLDIEDFQLTAATYTDANSPQGLVANTTAAVSYQGGFTGTLTAVLEKVDGKWRIFNINVNVPPDKFGP